MSNLLPRSSLTQRQVSLPLEQLGKTSILDTQEGPEKDGCDENISGQTGSSSDDIQQDRSYTADDSLRKSAVENHRDVELDESAESQTSYLHGVKLLMLMITLMTGQFIMGMDTTVITTATPKITATFGSLDQVGWYGGAYLLTTMALLPTFGKIYKYFSVKLTFVAAVVIFEAGSVICAVAPSSEILILGRAVAGIGQAAMVAGGMAMIAYSVPVQKRAIYLGILTSVDCISSVVGPVVGGVLTDSIKLTWRFCFWINLPVGALVIIIGLLTFESPVRPPSELTVNEKLWKMDITGASLFILGMVCLFIALERGGTQYAWSNNQVWGWLIGFALAMILFMSLQYWLGDGATIPPRIISQPPIALGCLYIALMSMSSSTLIYYLPFYFQNARGSSAEHSGLSMMPYLVSVVLSSLVIGVLFMTTNISLPFMLGGSALFSIAAGLFTTLKASSSSAIATGYQILGGVGFGATSQVAMVTVQACLVPDDIPTGNSLILFSIFLGAALGLNIAQSIFSEVLKQQLELQLAQTDVAEIIANGATGKLMNTLAVAALVRDAYAFAVTRAFFLPVCGGVLACLCAVGIWWRRKT